MDLDKLYGPSGYTVLKSNIVWLMHATHGVSLEITIPMLAEKGYVPAWDLLIEAARKDGANISRLIDRLCMIVDDAYKPNVAKVIRHYLPIVFGS